MIDNKAKNVSLSIVIPTYNQGSYIEDCLRSIQKQTFRNFEVIIQDSLSQDETEKICLRFVQQDARFKYYREKDHGQSDAINRGLARSTGELWTWICSDDYYAQSNAFEILVLVLKLAQRNDPEVVGVFGDAQYITEDGEIHGPYYNETRDLIRQDFKLTWPLSQPSSILLRQAVVDAGGVDSQLYLGMDLDLFLKVLKEDKKFVYAPSCMIVNIRLQPNSKSVKFRKKTAQNALMIVHKHFGEFGDLNSSAYFRELKFAQNEKIKGWLQQMVGCMPLGRQLVTRLQKLNQKIESYVNLSAGRLNFKSLLFRFIGRVFLVLKRTTLGTMKQNYQRLLEYEIHSKKNFIVSRKNS